MVSKNAANERLTALTFLSALIKSNALILRPCSSKVQFEYSSIFRGAIDETSEKKAHRRPDEKVQSSQANSGCMLSGARRVHPVIVGWSTANRPLIAQAHQW